MPEETRRNVATFKKGVEEVREVYLQLQKEKQTKLAALLKKGCNDIYKGLQEDIKMLQKNIVELQKSVMAPPNLPW